MPPMENWNMYKFIARGLVMVLALCASLAADASPYSALYVFGDSLSDNGNIPVTSPLSYRPSSPYADGRFSNGQVAAEYLASNLGVPLFDFAVGGATTGISNPDVPTLPNSGVMSQVNAFTSLHLAGVDSKALYMIWAGPNDVLNGISPIDAVSNIVAEVTALHALGAQRFLVPNMVDLSLTPLGALVPGAHDVSVIFDALLAAELPSYVTQFDTFSLLSDVVANPGDYGLTNATDPCFDGASVCANPDSYLFWDALHPTTAAHRILAAAFTSAVPEPNSIVLLGLALFALGFNHRKRA